MGTYDEEDEDHGPQTEAEYAVYEAEQAFNVMVEQWGVERAKKHMLSIMLRYGLDGLKEQLK